MNPVTVEQSSDGIYLVTLPGGGQRHNLSKPEVVRVLREEEERYQKVIDNLKSKRAEFEK